MRLAATVSEHLSFRCSLSPSFTLAVSDFLCLFWVKSIRGFRLIVSGLLIIVGVDERVYIKQIYIVKNGGCAMYYKNGECATGSQKWWVCHAL